MPRKSTKASTESKQEKSVEKEPRPENVQHDQTLASEYFGQYRIVDEAEISFRCAAKDSIAVKKWFGGIEWSLAKHGRDKTSLTCDSWAKGGKVLVDLHFYCLHSDEDAHLSMITETYKRQELTTGSEFEMENKEGLVLSGSVTWGVYVRVLKAWDIEKRPWNDPESNHTLIYCVRGRLFYVSKDFMASVSECIQEFVDKLPDSPAPVSVLHDPHEFDVFLHAIDGDDPVLPAPDTIRFLADFAYDYAIPTLMAKCEKHLKYCHEIPLVERWRMACDYDMEGAQGYLVGMVTNSEWTRARLEDEREKLTS